MYLKSLTLKGFKSFADRSALQFEPGATVVVGPNGSGKSNISDAVLWVLGEQSAKSLRGNTMEDVIFAGSSARRPVGVAEVDLVLDNASQTLPIEFSEVTITRRMFRNGESEYYINQTPCRLMDVHDLLHDSGLGRDTHSIISQGRLEDVLNSRPEDRRTLIEEAAGVLKHKKRKERAVRKLAAMDAHLSRVSDILGEIDRQLKPLQRQATRASEHADLTRSLTSVEVSLAVDDLRALQARWDELLKREKEADADIELSRYRLAEREKELSKFQSLLEEKGLFVGDLGEQRRRLQSVLERISAGLLLLEEKGKHLVERLSELRQKVHHAQSRLQARAGELERLEEERRSADGTLKGHYASLGELRREAEAAKKDRLAAEDALAEVNTGTRRVRRAIDDARIELSKVEQSLAAYTLEEKLLEDRAESLRRQHSSVHAALSARRTRLEQVEAAHAHTRKEAALAASDVDKRVRVLESRRKELADARERLAVVRAEILALEELDRAFESASPALAWALSKSGEIKGIVGPLAERIRVDDAYVRLVEQALGSDLFCLIVKDSATAVEVLRVLRAESVGDISLLPLDALPLKIAGQPTTGRPLLDFVKCESGVARVVEALLGDVYVVASLAEALEAAATDSTGARFATPDGEIVWATGKITVGSARDEAAGVLSRKRRLNELRDDEARTSSDVGETEAATAEAEDALAAAQQDGLEIGQRLAAAAGESESLREEIGRIEQSLTDLNVETGRLAERRQEIAQRTVKDRPFQQELETRIAEHTAALESLEEQGAERREERDNRFREETALSGRLAQCQVDIATVSEREVHLKRQLSAIHADVAELQTTVEQSNRTEAGLELLRDRIQPLHDLYSALLDRAEHWAAKLRDRARLEQADSVSLRDTIHAAQDSVREVQSEIDEKSTAMSGILVEKGQLEIQVTTAVGRIVDDFGMPLETALDLPPVEDRQRTLDEAHRLRKQLANLGPVNAVAVDEYNSLRGRRDFITEQMEDLVSSRSSLQKVIAAIDRKMRDRFLETFEQVDRHFQEVFSVLFPGGRSALILTEPDDPEITGVEVVAEPLGKKLSKMSLLSGGEKSLCALALLFAVYRTRPCPFYVLDEVDAALDDTNLRRFVTFVDSLRSRTQFIIVTHQRRTMEMADVLYGVSMQADGVSKVVSQKLDRSSSDLAAPEEIPGEHSVV